MSKRLTDIQKMINFAMAADEASLNQAIEGLIAIRSNRYPKERKQGRKTRSDKGGNRPPRTPSQTVTQTAPPANGQSSLES